MSAEDPYVTRADDGTCTLTEPDPPRLTYEVAAELLHEWVAEHNELIALRMAAKDMQQATAIGRKLLERTSRMDPLKRAQVCAAALGRGWADLVDIGIEPL